MDTKFFFEDDRNIMEVAVEDTKYTGRNNWKLEIINNCKLYVKIFYIGEMMNKDGKVDLKILNGTIKTHNTRYNIPNVRHPP